MFTRKLQLNVPERQSIFLWGARQTGKSTYLKQHYPNAQFISFLHTDIFVKYSKSPALLRSEILAMDEKQLKYPIILDEVQKIPELLDEVHWLIENTPAYFILCGSSARKLKRSGVNLLGGRAWRYHFYPLISEEIPDFDLLKALNTGLLPPHYLSHSSQNAQKALEAYVEVYLTEEIKEEGLVRSLPHFARFLDSMAFSNGEMVKYSNIARDCGVDAKTVQSYFQILVDTLLGYYVLPYRKKITREIITQTPKFYLFDVGVAGFLSHRTINQLKGSEAGKAFEHFIFMELIAYKNLMGKYFDIAYWRTKSGLEVDFILGDAQIALEIKISSQVEKQDLKGLIEFSKLYKPQQAIVVSQDSARRLIQIENGTDILICPWKDFLKSLWGGEFLI